MKSPKTYLIALLTLTTLGGAGLAWQQYRELVELRAAAMNPDERADLQKRAWDLEKLNRELQDQLAALRTEDADGMLAAAGDPPPADAGRGGRGQGGRGGRGAGQQQQMNAIRDLMAKPEVQALLSVQQKAVIDARYAALFRNLNLPPEQLDKLKTLLAERQTTQMDVMNAAREQGLDPRTDPAGFRKLLASAQNDMNSSIKAAIGDAGFAQLQTYEQTLPQRNVVDQLQQRLSYTDTPLTSAQADQLVQILAANTPPRTNNTANGAAPGQPPQGGRGPGGFGGGGGLGLGGGFGGGGGNLGGMLAGALGGGPGGGVGAVLDGGGRGGATAPVTTAAVSQAQTVLAPPQLSALQQIQQQQQSQQQLQQLLRDTAAANQPPGGKAGGGNTGGAAGGANQNRKRGGGG